MSESFAFSAMLTMGLFASNTLSTMSVSDSCLRLGLSTFLLFLLWVCPHLLLRLLCLCLVCAYILVFHLLCYIYYSCICYTYTWFVLIFRSSAFSITMSVMSFSAFSSVSTMFVTGLCLCLGLSPSLLCLLYLYLSLSTLRLFYCWLVNISFQNLSLASNAYLY